MRSKTVRCSAAPQDSAKLARWPFHPHHIVLTVDAASRRTAVHLSPGRARELGKALIRMAGETEQK